MDYLKAGLGRWLPAMPDLVKDDPFWLDPKDPHRSAYAHQGLLSPTVPFHSVFNSGFSEASSHQIWGTAAADVIRERTTPKAAVEKALHRGRAGEICRLRAPRRSTARIAEPCRWT